MIWQTGSWWDGHRHVWMTLPMLKFIADLYVYTTVLLLWVPGGVQDSTLGVCGVHEFGEVCIFVHYEEPLGSHTVLNSFCGLVGMVFSVCSTFPAQIDLFSFCEAQVTMCIYTYIYIYIYIYTYIFSSLVMQLNVMPNNWIIWHCGQTRSRLVCYNCTVHIFTDQWNLVPEANY